MQVKNSEEFKKSIIRYIQQELPECVGNFVDGGCSVAAFSGDIFSEDMNGELSSDEMHFIIASHKAAWLFKVINVIVGKDPERASRIGEIIREHLQDESLRSE
jgi:hypothetical protein